MIRARFTVALDDPRPLTWPIKHPYWVTGYDSDEAAILVAYADDEAQILSLWPEAENIEAEEVSSYQFTSRFSKPEWFKAVK